MAENLVQQHCWTEAEVLQGCNVCWVGNYTAGTGDKGKSYSTELCSLYRKLFRDRWLQRTVILSDETLPFACVCVCLCVCLQAHVHTSIKICLKKQRKCFWFPWAVLRQSAVAQIRHVWRESPISPHLTHQSRILMMMSKAMSMRLHLRLYFGTPPISQREQ